MGNVQILVIYEEEVCVLNRYRGKDVMLLG
jgi:hypothetical protein